MHIYLHSYEKNIYGNLLYELAHVIIEAKKSHDLQAGEGGKPVV